jgi:hypothetical protein
MKDLTSGGGFSLLNEVDIISSCFVNSVSNIKPTILATSWVDRSNQNSEDIRSQLKYKLKEESLGLYQL